MQATQPVTYQSLPGSITAVHKTYHHRPGEQPVMTESTWERRLATRARPVVRDLSLGQEWVRVDCSAASYLSLSNSYPARATIPTPEERDEAEAPAVEISFSNRAYAPSLHVEVEAYTPHVVVPVGEGVEFTPAAACLWLRARAGVANVVLTEYPR